jgi:hypothetical protein
LPQNEVRETVKFDAETVIAGVSGCVDNCCAVTACVLFFSIIFGKPKTGQKYHTFTDNDCPFAGTPYVSLL